MRIPLTNLDENTVLTIVRLPRLLDYFSLHHPHQDEEPECE